MDKPAPAVMEAKNIIFTDPAGNQISVQALLELMMINLDELNEFVYDIPEHPTSH